MKLEDIMRDPAQAYDMPADVCRDDALDRDQKIKVLHRWEYDARQLLVAEGEGMNLGDAEKLLHEVIEALQSMDAESGVE